MAAVAAVAVVVVVVVAAAAAAAVEEAEEAEQAAAEEAREQVAQPAGQELAPVHQPDMAAVHQPDMAARLAWATAPRLRGTRCKRRFRLMPAASIMAHQGSLRESRPVGIDHDSGARDASGVFESSCPRRASRRIRLRSGSRSQRIRVCSESIACATSRPLPWAGATASREIEITRGRAK